MNNDNKILLYQVGDFFEVFNDDAKTVAEMLELVLTSRAIGRDERVPMAGFPRHRLESYLNMITDRGFDVAVCSLENGERKTYTIVSQNKEDPVESKVVGRIDYFHTVRLKLLFKYQAVVKLLYITIFDTSNPSFTNNITHIILVHIRVICPS